MQGLSIYCRETAINYPKGALFQNPLGVKSIDKVSVFTLNRHTLQPERRERQHFLYWSKIKDDN